MKLHSLAAVLTIGTLPLNSVNLPSTPSIPSVAQALPATASDIIQVSPRTPKLTVKVWSGRITAIDFSLLNQRITSIALADPSRLVYNTDVLLEQGTASTIYLRQIQLLRFPGATTTSVTNLIVKTNSRNTYVFNVVAANGKPDYSMIQLSNRAPVYDPAQPLTASTNHTTLTREAIDLDCVEAGIQVAIDRKFAKADDPLFDRVRNFLQQARSGVPVAIAAEWAIVSPSLIIKLNQLGIQQH
ncbi:MAG: hypothetical protein NW224_12645 [Leptolyngbyaceae cyanobacterium bins.302]|nr:hypothetical protein [Leptolyngbyaceae cyanobacterium bins.302]